MAKLTILCQLNGGCMGCCGHDFHSKQKIKEAIKRNNKEFWLVDKDNPQDLIYFRDRAHPYDLRFGVCRNLIEEKGRIFCPLHPALNKKDLREGHCAINHLCLTAIQFNKWNIEKQQKFLDFIKSKNLDNVEYSMLMDNNGLLNEFLAEESL